ncbi:MAG: 6-phosphofructokinase [Deltaproteobacteria bacterium]|uniref:Pyrophosphate--fructose 6-phosphate 1-phosphotransferase n=1 Tax=Candidatus Zymogenus saltonus TaxID=2844893 RepID=A0A9D8PSJ2_9DELT|nr:6-phosphofructokinase [Candidatus Zymogenus saltonus]
MKKLSGKAVIAQGGGPTAVINQSLVGAVLQARRYPQITNFYGALGGVVGLMEEDFVDLTQASTHNLEVVAGTPGAGILSSRHKPNVEDCLRIFEVLKVHGIRYFFFIGGNDSAETCRIVNENAEREGYELRVIHIPKTIDNDILITDHCPGYGSAAKFVAQAFAGANMDNRSLPGVYIGVVMGRHAGFLTASSIFAKKYDDDGPHLIYLPEKPFSPDLFIKEIDETMTKFGRCVVAVSEGINDAEESPIITSLVDQVERDSHGNVQLSGLTSLGDALVQLVKTELSIKRVRSDTFGYLQRSFLGCASSVDAQEAREVGEWALQFATWNNIDGSVVIERVGDYAVRYGLVDLKEVTGGTKSMPDEFIEGDSMVTTEFKNYARPLLGRVPDYERIHAPMVDKIMKE